MGSLPEVGRSVRPTPSFVKVESVVAPRHGTRYAASLAEDEVIELPSAAGAGRLSAPGSPRPVRNAARALRRSVPTVP
jgi:hypothetical protein